MTQQPRPGAHQRPAFVMHRSPCREESGAARRILKYDWVPTTYRPGAAEERASARTLYKGLAVMFFVMGLGFVIAVIVGAAGLLE